jgi:hypothetical protein
MAQDRIQWLSLVLAALNTWVFILQCKLIWYFFCAFCLYCISKNLKLLDFRKDVILKNISSDSTRIHTKSFQPTKETDKECRKPVRKLHQV